MTIGGAAAGISAAGGGAMLAGAGAGRVGGAGFSGLATGWNGEAMLKGAFVGAAAGFVGGGFASAIGANFIHINLKQLTVINGSYLSNSSNWIMLSSIIDIS